MLEWLSPSFIYGLGKDLLNFIRPNRKRITAEQRMALREKWRPLFAEELYRCLSEKLRQDVIIHDVARPNEYPESKETVRKISSWFRVAFVGQYHKGIEVALGIYPLIYEDSESSWRLADSDENGSINAYQIGYIPYESIVSVNWSGDEYYGYPHIFCHFEYHGQPYERLMFCEKRKGVNDRPYFSELASTQEVKLTSLKFGTAWAWVSD